MCARRPLLVRPCNPSILADRLVRCDYTLSGLRWRWAVVVVAPSGGVLLTAERGGGWCVVLASVAQGFVCLELVGEWLARMSLCAGWSAWFVGGVAI